MTASARVETSTPGKDPNRGLGLSTKLLLLTVGFVMLAEVLVFAPSVANFRRSWLMERLSAAHLASLTVLAAPSRTVPGALRDELLKRAQVKSVAIKREASRELILQEDMPESIDASFDLRNAMWWSLIVDAIGVYVAPPGRVIRVVGQPGMGPGEFIEVVMGEGPLQAAMVSFGLNIFGLSILISIITATLVYLSLKALFVRPVTRLTAAMMRFRDQPEDRSRIIVPSDRKDEIGTAERELASMQTQLSDTLGHKSRLAALGLAVSKINHDLRNMLSTAQLLSDRLGAVHDPTVQRFAPKLVQALDRAIRLCADTLEYGRSHEAPPRRERFLLAFLAAEVGEGLGLPRDGGADWAVDIHPKLEIEADRDQLFRVLNNLVRNAVEAVEAHEGKRGLVAVNGRRDGAVVTIDVEDSGPGLSPRKRDHLFEPFQGSERQGGTGLGLAIASEIIALHGGTIALVEGAGATTFRIIIPDPVLQFAKSRRSA